MRLRPGGPWVTVGRSLGEGSGDVTPFLKQPPGKARGKKVEKNVKLFSWAETSLTGLAAALGRQSQRRKCRAVATGQ
jgi:hypothetical protein